MSVTIRQRLLISEADAQELRDEGILPLMCAVQRSGVPMSYPITLKQVREGSLRALMVGGRWWTSVAEVKRSSLAQTKARRVTGGLAPIYGRSNQRKGRSGIAKALREVFILACRRMALSNQDQEALAAIIGEVRQRNVRTGHKWNAPPKTKDGAELDQAAEAEESDDA